MREASHLFGRGRPVIAPPVLHSIFLVGAVDGSIFVLFVDNDTAFANAAARSFQSVGMRTLLVLGSRVDIDVFDNFIDVIITDISMPVLNGIDAVDELRNKLGLPQKEIPAATPNSLIEICHHRFATPMREAKLTKAKEQLRQKTVIR